MKSYYDSELTYYERAVVLRKILMTLNKLELVNICKMHDYRLDEQQLQAAGFPPGDRHFVLQYSDKNDFIVYEREIYY